MLVCFVLCVFACVFVLWFVYYVCLVVYLFVCLIVDAFNGVSLNVIVFAGLCYSLHAVLIVCFYLCLFDRVLV